MDIIPPKALKAGLKQYRKDVPSVGTVSSEAVDQLFAEGRICRGWTTLDGQIKYFHIIKSPSRYPEKSVSFGESEKELFQMTIHLGMQHGIDLNDLLTE